MKKMKLYKGYTIILLIFIINISAAPDVSEMVMKEEKQYFETINLSETSELNELIEFALHNNPGLKSAFYNFKKTVLKIPQVGAFPDPQISYGYFIRNVETRVGPQQHKISIGQKFPWFGKLQLKEDKISQIALMKYELFQHQKSKLTYEIKKLYYELYYLNQSIDITRQNINLLNDIENVLLAKYKTSQAGYHHLIKTQLELDTLKDKLESLQNKLEPNYTKMQVLLNNNKNIIFTMPDYIDSQVIAVDKTEIKTKIFKFNPELNALEHAIKSGKIDKKLAEKDYYPDITFGVDYVMTGPSSMSTIDNGKDPMMAMIKLNIPLWYDKLNAGIDEAKTHVEFLNETYNNKKNMLIAELDLVLFKLNDSSRKIKLYDESLIPRSRQSLNAIEKAFRTGTVDFLNLIDAQRLLLNYQLAYQRSIVDYRISLAKLDMMVGNI